jgi:hypothetical protein
MKFFCAVFALVLCLTTGVVNASKIKVKTESKGTIDLGKMHRFAITEPNSIRPDLTNGTMTPEFRIRTGLISELDARGFEQVPAEYADFLVTCSVSYRYSVDSNKVDRKNQPKHGEVAVEFFDATDKRSLWRGQVTTTVHGLDESGWEVDGTRALINSFLKDMGVKLLY